MHLIINAVAFKVGWISSVVGAAQQMPWLGPLVVLVAVAIHLSKAGRPASELTLIIACAALGAGFDSALVAMGWVSYPSGMFSALLAPYWIIGMWIVFATTLNVSLRWLKGRRLLAIAIGLAAGPASYLAGNEIGAITFIERDAALLALATGWAVMLPLLVYVAEAFDGVGAPVAQPAAPRG